jgi:uncharacterized membrane protein YadS
MSSGVAAATIFGHGATATAVVVKLTRTLMIIPITIVLALWRARTSPHQAEGPARRSAISHVRSIFPVFIVWFLVAVTANTVGLLPHAWHTGLSELAQLMITVALAGIGLSTRMRDISRTGLKPLALGAVLWVLVGTTSLGLQWATGTIH